MKLDVWSAICTDDLSTHGFRRYKPGSFIRVVNDVLQYLSFQGQKHDLYIWRNSLPLSLPGLWPHMGWRHAAGRMPSTEGQLRFADPEGLAAVQHALLEILRGEALPCLDSVVTPEALYDQLDDDQLPFAAFPKAFCMFQSKRYERARTCLARLLGDPLERAVEKAHAARYLALSDAAIPSAIAGEIEINVKSNRLRKFLHDS